MIQNGIQQTSKTIITRIKPSISHSNCIQYLHCIQKSYHIPPPANEQNSAEQKSRNRIEKDNKKENKRYDNEEDELENSCYSINQARDSPNMGSTACTKKLRREVSCISSSEGLCTEVITLISSLSAMC